MRKSTAESSTILLDCIRPHEADGPLIGAVFSTYGLSLDQPDFFGQDFLPTLLGLGGVRDRGYACPATLDRVLANADLSLICDAHALTAGVRPTLRVDVLPVGHRLQHAKVTLIHRRNRIRLIVASANLTHEGYRKQREAAVVLDFHEEGRLSPAVLLQALSRWEEVLGSTADQQVRRVFAQASQQASQWASNTPYQMDLDVQVVFGGGATPLWRQLVDAWPTGEPVLHWQVCSPFWPQVEDSAARTPFEAMAAALIEKGCAISECDLELITRASTPSPQALPLFPFSLVRYLRAQGFPIHKGRILPARLDAAVDEVPDGYAPENRALHAKWIVLAGPKTMVALLGSANFTRKGLGVLPNTLSANIEAGVLLSGPRGKWHPQDWRPPIQGHEIDWASCCEADVNPPPAEEEKLANWAGFVQRVELLIRWENLPEPDGELRVHAEPGEAPAFRVGIPSSEGDNPAHVEVAIGTASPFCTALSPSQVRLLLAGRVVEIVWSAENRSCLFPVNILHESKTGMPSVLGAKPSEQQLLAYFHGRISEEDLLTRLEQEARSPSHANNQNNAEDSEQSRRLQSYVVREFVEGLYGLAQTIQEAAYSPRAAEQALMGDFSPVCLAEQVVQAFFAGKRSPTAAGFQIAELIRVVAEITWPVAATNSEEVKRAFAEVRQRTLDRLFSLVQQAAARPDFRGVIRDPDFSTFINALMPIDLAYRWHNLVTAGGTPETPARQGVGA